MRHLAFYDQDVASIFPGVQGPYFVREGEVFVVGDNRFNPHDSRMWYGGQGGGVPISTLRGMPTLIWLSINAQGGGVLTSRSGLDLEVPHLAPWMADCRPASTVA